MDFDLFQPTSTTMYNLVPIVILFMFSAVYFTTVETKQMFLLMVEDIYSILLNRVVLRIAQ